MARLSILILTLITALSLGLSSVECVAGGGACFEIGTATVAIQTFGNADQVPADSEKGNPHHHAGCHGHCVGVPVSTNAVAPVVVMIVTPFAFDHSQLARVAGAPSLRPPQA